MISNLKNKQGAGFRKQWFWKGYQVLLSPPYSIQQYVSE